MSSFNVAECVSPLNDPYAIPLDKINVSDPDPVVEGKPLVTKLIENAGLKTVMSNSFGFGGTNGTLVFQKR